MIRPPPLPCCAPTLADEAPLRELPEVAALTGSARPRLAVLCLPIAPHDAERIEAALANGDDDELLTTTAIAGIKLRRGDARTLRPGVWLNDEVMNLYFELLLRRHAAFTALREESRVAHVDAQRPGPAPPPLRPVHIFPTNFWVKLNQVRRCSA